MLRPALLGALVAACTALAGAQASLPEPDFPEMVHLARLYYSVRYETPEETRRAWESAYGELALVDLPATQNRYLLGTLRGGTRQEIVIRGTANFVNAVYDAEVAKSWNAELQIRLHRGFERMALALYADLRPRLLRDAELVLFGHSLGAAEAVVVGMLLTHDGYRLKQIYASGQPKVTDAAGAERWKDLPVLRISCEGDPIPLLPPRSVVSASPYVHLGPEILLLDGPYYFVADDRSGDEVRLSEVWSLLRAETLRGALDVHYFRAYYPRYLSKEGGAIREATGPQLWEELVPGAVPP